MIYDINCQNYWNTMGPCWKYLLKCPACFEGIWILVWWIRFKLKLYEMSMILFRNIIKSVRINSTECKWLECHWQPANWKYLRGVHIKTESYLHRALWAVNYRIQKWLVRVYWTIGGRLFMYLWCCLNQSITTLISYSIYIFNTNINILCKMSLTLFLDYQHQQFILLTICSVHILWIS